MLQLGGLFNSGRQLFAQVPRKLFDAFEFIADILRHCSLRNVINACRYGLGKLGQLGGLFAQFDRIESLRLRPHRSLQYQWMLGNLEFSGSLGGMFVLRDC